MSENQISMLKERIRSVGISILGGNGGIEGKYELGIDSVQLVNEEDIESPLGVALRPLPSFDLTCLPFILGRKEPDQDVGPPSNV